MNRLDTVFKTLKAEGRKAFSAFVMASDPHKEASLEILKSLPKAGVDFIELGMPFTDPAADGPVIQAAGTRALNAGASMIQALEIIKEFRKEDTKTPIVLMGYFNPVYRYGPAKFAADAKASGADAVLVADLPVGENDFGLHEALTAEGIALIGLVTPTTDTARLKEILETTSGFCYYISIAGTTGTKDVETEVLQKNISRIKEHTDLPIAVGFGIKTPAHVAAVTNVADAAIVGSAIVQKIAENLNEEGGLKTSVSNLVENVSVFVHSLSDAVKK
ncbi:MAG: tryptophan synthase subunit alpha [Alphaproteobacteria bacterium]